MSWAGKQLINTCICKKKNQLMTSNNNKVKPCNNHDCKLGQIDHLSIFEIFVCF